MRCVDVTSLEKLFRKECRMSLVAYGVSDDSGSDSEETDKVLDVEDSEDKDDVLAPGSGLFSSLPAPRSTSMLSLDDLVKEEPLSTSHVAPKKQTVKITVPSLSEFKDDENMEPEKKKLKPSVKGSGLFALLPAPKHLTVKEVKRSLVPNSVSKKPANIRVNPAPSVAKQSKPALLTDYGDSGDELDEDAKADFFSLNTAAAVESAGGEVPGLEASSEEMDVAVASSDDGVVAERGCETLAASPQPDQDDQDLLLNKEAMQRLCGRRGTRDAAAMRLIEVSGDTLMPDPKEWLTKQLTEEQQHKSHSHRKNDGPTTQQKRKHHITYLAFQAKENELELKNQWSQNRMSRKQTQSKYGF